jgi:ABC-type Fe3+-hydroxamate transport system substrate-binding protein
MSKNSEPLIKQMQQKIEDAKQELKALEEKIRQVESEENNG